MTYRDGYRATEEQDRLHRHQLWWSFAVACTLGVAVLYQIGNPKNALMEQDRAPAAVVNRMERPDARPESLRTDLASHEIPGLPSAPSPETHLE